jgi:hypothetical protein
VVGDAEEELVVERRVDEPEHVRPPGLHLQLVRVCHTRRETNPLQSII